MVKIKGQAVNLNTTTNRREMGVCAGSEEYHAL